MQLEEAGTHRVQKPTPGETQRGLYSVNIALCLKMHDLDLLAPK